MKQNSYLRRTRQQRRIKRIVRQIEQIIESRCGTRPTRNNRIELLNDGPQMYAALIRALQRARHTIHLEYYIFDDDRIGQAISELLIRRAHSGVKVRLIYDLMGSWMPAWGMLRKLREAGVEVLYFRPLKGWNLLRWFNVRNHRKLAVIDDQVAFLGGINIARRYLEGNELGHWRDEHLRLEGEVVYELQRLFVRDWQAVGGAPIRLCKVSPNITGKGVETQIAWSEEGCSRRVLEEVLTELVNSARREILLATPYFVPTPALQEALKRALERGVRVELMLPARADLRLVSWAAEEYCLELLRLGALVYGYERGFLHTKMVVVDGSLAALGTANLDYRSLRTNWEVMAFICDDDFSRKVAETFSRDRASCLRLDSEGMQRRSPIKVAVCRLATLFSRWL